MWILSAQKILFFGHWQSPRRFLSFHFYLMFICPSAHNTTTIKARNFCWLFFHLSIANRFLNALFCLLFDSFFLWAPQKFYFKMADVKLLLNADYYSERYFFHIWILLLCVLTWTLDSGKLIFSATSSRL